MLVSLPTDSSKQTLQSLIKLLQCRPKLVFLKFKSITVMMIFKADTEIKNDRITRKPVFRADTNQSVQTQRIVRGWKLRI